MADLCKSVSYSLIFYRPPNNKFMVISIAYLYCCGPCYFNAIICLQTNIIKTKKLKTKTK